MSGHSSETYTSAHFDAMMQLLDEAFSVDSPFPFGLSDRFLERYEASGSLDWHKYYRMVLIVTET